MAIRFSRYGLAAGLAGAMAIPAAGIAAAQDEETVEFETYEVTGSRIRRVDYETGQPVLQIGRAEIEQSGLTSIGDLLQDLTIAGSGLNTTFNNGGTGSTEIDLRNLGSNRVLVLVNGRRWVRGAASLRDAVDLNTIPVSIVESIEILKEGASAIYGSDAVAGVVNIRTVQDYNGAEFRSQYGEYDEGDGAIQTHSLTIGNTSDKTSIVADVSYTRAEPAFAADREISREPQFGTGNVFGSSGTPRGRFFFLGEPGSGNDPVNDLTLIPGEDGRQAEDFEDIGSERFNFAPFNYLLTPQERRSAYAQFSHSITNSVRLSGEVLYNNRLSEQLLAPTPLFLGAFAGNDLSIAEDNRFNPFGQEIGQENAGFVGRRMVEVGNRIFKQDVDTYRIGVGFDGDFSAGNGFGTWDVNYIQSRSESNQSTTGLLNLNNVRLGLGSDDACAASPGCVPFNLFGGPGSITQDQVDFVTFTAQDQQEQSLEAVSGNMAISGLFELPAGPVGIAIGTEYREESGQDVPDALIASGASSGNIRQPTAGGFDLTEFYAELELPLVADVRGINELTVNIAARYSDYSNFGDTTNGQARIAYRPIEDLLFRATVSESFRAPSISELFQGQSDSFPIASDPCSDIDTSDPNEDASAAVIANCAADGAPNDGSYSQFNEQIESTVGGNPNLSPEEGESFTAGVVWSVGAVDGLSFALDYFDYEVEGFISNLSTQNILTTCAETGVLCDLTTRAANGALTDVLSVNVNLGRLITKGFDFVADYDIPFFADYGNFKTQFSLTYVDEYRQQLPDPTTGAFVGENIAGDNLGDFALPRVKANLNTSWKQGNWGASWILRYFGEQDEDCDEDFIEFGQCSNPEVDRGAGFVLNTLEATVYNDVQVTYNMPGFNTLLTFGVNNILDEDPPVSTSAFANSFDASLYEIPGVFPYARVRVNF